MLKGLHGLIIKFDTAVAIIGGLFLLGLMFFICADVFMRAVFNSPFPGSVEICALGVVYVIYFGFAYALTKGAHVRVTLIIERFPRRFRQISMIIAYSIGSLFFGAATWRTWIYFWKSFVSKEFMFASIEIPWYLGKFAVPVGTLFMCITFLIYLILTLAGNAEEK